MYIIITLEGQNSNKYKTSSLICIKKCAPYITSLFIPAKFTRISRAFRNCRKSAKKAPIEARKLFVLPVTQKGWIKNVEMRQKIVQSHCNNVRTQENSCKKRRTGCQAVGATEGFRNDEREGRELQ